MKLDLPKRVEPQSSVSCDPLRTAIARKTAFEGGRVTVRPGLGAYHSSWCSHGRRSFKCAG